MHSICFCYLVVRIKWSWFNSICLFSSITCIQIPMSILQMGSNITCIQIPMSIFQMGSNLGKINHLDQGSKQTHLWVGPLVMSHLDVPRPIQLCKIIGNIFINIFISFLMGTFIKFHRLGEFF